MQTTKENTKPRIALKTKRTAIGYSFILPNFIGFFIFILIPVIFSFVLSFMKWDGFNEMEFVGLQNFVRVFKDSVFRASIFQTLYYVVFTVALTFIASLGLALLVNQKLRGVSFFRSAIFFPYVASIVAVGVVWNMMFQKDFGPINAFLRWLGMQDVPGWTASTTWAIPAVIIVSVWKNMGYFMIVYLAALQDIPVSLYEAATIDGASSWQKFKRITFPMLTPPHFFVFMMLTINSFKIFDLILVMTEGGPGTATTMLSYYIYNQSFISWDYGKASAGSMILFLVVGTITILQFRAEKKFSSFM